VKTKSGVALSGRTLNLARVGAGGEGVVRRPMQWLFPDDS
jgi:hypothetical protein